MNICMYMITKFSYVGGGKCHLQCLFAYLSCTGTGFSCEINICFFLHHASNVLVFDVVSEVFVHVMPNYLQRIDICLSWVSQRGVFSICNLPKSVSSFGIEFVLCNSLIGYTYVEFLLKD